MGKTPKQEAVSKHPNRQAGLKAQGEFLEAYASLGLVVDAAKRVGIHPRQHGIWMQHDAEYREAFYESEGLFVDRLEAEMFRRGVEGVEKPIYQKGERVDAGEVREYSDTLLVKLHQVRAPEKHRAIHEHQGPAGGPVEFHVVYEDEKD